MSYETFVFTPYNYLWDWITVGFAMISLLGFLVISYQLFFYRNRDDDLRSYKTILSLVILATFLSTIAFFYSLQTNKRLQIVALSPQGIQTPFGKCAISSIKKVYFFPEEKPLSSTLPSTRYLIFEEKNGHQHPLASDTYDLKAIHKAWLKLVE